MNTSETLKLTGKLTIEVNDKVVRHIDNLVTTAGKGLVAARLASAGSTVVTHMALGTGTTAAAVGDTTMETEVTRQAIDVSGGTVSTNTITYTRTFAANDPVGAAAITEAGLFNDVTTGTMLAHTVFPVVNKGVSDTMTISWVVTIS